MDRAKTLLCEALDADSIDLKQLAIKNYLEAAVTFLIEPKLSLDQLIFEDDFEIKNRIVEETKKTLDLVEKCLKRTSELFELIENEENEVILNSSNSQISSPGGSSPIRKQPNKAFFVDQTASNSIGNNKSSARKSSRGVVTDLSQVRKQFEKASLAEIIARQKKQLENPIILPKQQSTSAPPRFTINLQMISDLLTHRQDAISHLNTKLFSFFDTEKESVNDDIWRRTLRISISTSSGDLMQPIGPIIGLFSHPSHPISQISRDFILRLKQLTNSPEDTSKQISEEYHQFSYQMIKLLRHNYQEELADDSLDLPLQISIETFMFSHLPGLGTGITEMFSKANQQEDAAFLSQLTQLSWLNFDHEDALYTILNVPEKYRLPASKYDPAVAELRSAASLKCPTAKALAVVKVCDLICSAIEKETEEDSFCIGSEDLVLLLSWIIVQAQVKHMITFFALISEFLPEELIRGQAGYMLATMQTCLDYIKNIN